LSQDKEQIRIIEMIWDLGKDNGIFAFSDGYAEALRSDPNLPVYAESQGTTSALRKISLASCQTQLRYSKSNQHQ
jgi:hypothetical protein